MDDLEAARAEVHAALDVKPGWHMGRPEMARSLREIGAGPGAAMTNPMTRAGYREGAVVKVRTGKYLGGIRLAIVVVLTLLGCAAQPPSPQIIPGLDATFTAQDGDSLDGVWVSAEEAVARVLATFGEFPTEELAPLGPPGIVEYGIAACLNSPDCFGPNLPPERPAWLVAWLDRGPGSRWASFLVDAQTSEILAQAPAPDGVMR